MKNYTFLLVIALMLLLTLPALALSSDLPLTPVIPGMPLDGPEAIDGTYLLGPQEKLVRMQMAQSGFLPSMSSFRATEMPAEVLEPGAEIVVNVYDSGAETNYDETFVVTLIGAHGIILVTKDAYESFDGIHYQFSNPNGDDSLVDNGEESIPQARTIDLLSVKQLNYLLAEFDNNIYPTDTRVFGEPLPRGAQGQKVWILIHNIRDDAYYDLELKTYVAGYFSASEDLQNNKNMMHIDTYDWANRVGPDATRPFLYESTFAHEFQHLIHFDIDPDEPSWVDEGCADLAGYMCGYGHPRAHVAYYLIFHPLTSLTFWGNGLEDYGASYLFILYLYEKYGKDAFITDLVLEQTNGIEGIEKTLSNLGYHSSFNEIFDTWIIANLLDDSSIYDGRYGYESIEIGSDDSAAYTIQSALESYWEKPYSVGPFEIASDWSGADPKPYTANYYPFYNKKITQLGLSGDEFSGVPAYSGNFEWYSDAEAWAWRGITQDFDIPDTGATLNFKTYFEIEENWDYAYVEVFDHSTGEWSTLDAPGTTDTLPFAQDNPNVPVQQEPSTYFSNGKWHAFTGVSGAWLDVEMDLTPFAGHKISLWFRSWQDGASSLQMIYVDDISIPEIGFFDDVENGSKGWTADNWVISDGKFDNNLEAFSLNIYDPPKAEEGEEAKNKKCFKLHGPWKEFLHPFYINPIKVDSETQEGIGFVRSAPEGGDYKNITIITNHADHQLGSHYEFSAEKLKWSLFKKYQ